MQQDKGETSSSVSAEAGSSKQTADTAQEEKFSESAKKSKDKPQNVFFESGRILEERFRNNMRRYKKYSIFTDHGNFSRDWPHNDNEILESLLSTPCSSSFTTPSPAVKPDTIQEGDQKPLTSDVKRNDPSPHKANLPDSGNMFPGPSVEPIDRVSGVSATKFQPKYPPHTQGSYLSWSSIHILPSAHASTSSYTGDSLSTGKEELDKDKPMTVEEKLSGGDVDEKLSDQNAPSSPSSSSSLFRLGVCSGGKTKWIDLERPHSCATVPPPDKRIRLLSPHIGYAPAAFPSTSIGASFSNDSSPAEKGCLLHSTREQTQDELRPAEYSLPADSDPQQTVDLFQGTGENFSYSSSSSSGEIMSPQTPCFLSLSDQSPTTPSFVSGFEFCSRRFCDIDHFRSISIPGLQDYSAYFPNSVWSRAQAELSTVQSEPKSGDGVDESCLVTNILPRHAPIGTCSSGPSWTEGVSGSLPRSQTFPSLSDVTSAKNKTLTRAQSSSDLQFNSSCEQFTPDITSGYSSIRLGRYSGNKTKWTNPDLPESPETFLPQKKGFKYLSSAAGYAPANRARFSYNSSPAEKGYLHLTGGQTQDSTTVLQDEFRPAEYSLPADSDPQQTVDLLQGTRQYGPVRRSSHSSEIAGLHTSGFHSLCLPPPPPSFFTDFYETSFNLYDSGSRDFSAHFNLSDSIPDPQDHSSDLQNSSTVTEGSRAQAELSSVQSEPYSGGGVDESCSVTLSTHAQIQTFSPGPSWTEGVSGSLPRSHSCPSLSHMTSAGNKTLTRAQSSPYLQFNSSCEQFTPDVTADEDDETYRFQCSSPGLYQCIVTGLVFHMEGEGDVVYRTVPWNRKLLSQHHKQPAGPLFDIKCEQQSVCQLHLPHCEIRSTGGADFLSVAHLDEEVFEFIGPHKITETHVVINITGFSAFGNVKDEDSPPDPVRAMVLVFYKPPADPDPTSFLNILLLPRNVVLTSVLHYRKKLDGDERYVPVPPYCKLHPQQEYTLSTCPQDDSVLVEPTTAEFDSDHYHNYLPSFQVTLEKNMKHLRLFLRDTNNSSLSVWERRVCLSSSGVQKSCGQSTLNLSPDKRLFEIRSSFIERVSGPVLKSLLDKLLEKTVMTDSERESVDEMRNRGDKARLVIDTVRKKGEAASSEMIDALCDLDPFFSEHLGLM